jgi:hypothetical protein
MRIANKAADRIEDQIDSANISQATITFGVATDKINLLSGDPTIHFQHSIEHPSGNANWLYDRINELAAAFNTRALSKPLPSEPLAAQPALANGETISDSGR